MIPIHAGFAPFAEKYDAFILDLWGVIHDGTRPYPGALDVLGHLKAMGKPTAILSNAPRRPDAAIEAMERIGIPRDLYGEVLTSGEATYLELKTRRDPFFAALGRKLFHLGPKRDVSVYSGLDYLPVADPAEADFILNTGPVEFTHGLQEYEAVLAAAAARDLPMICANPDLVVIREGVRILCAGGIAKRYRELGGRVAERGKPDPAIYDLLLSQLPGIPRGRILAVGDSLETDIRGAANAGIDALFVAGGIHGESLGLAWGETPDPEKLAALCRSWNLAPAAAIPAFRW